MAEALQYRCQIDADCLTGYRCIDQLCLPGGAGRDARSDGPAAPSGHQAPPHPRVPTAPAEISGDKVWSAAAHAVDGFSGATPLDALKTGLESGRAVPEIREAALFGALGGSGWEWIALAWAAGHRCDLGRVALERARALAAESGAREVMVIGGGQVYEETLTRLAQQEADMVKQMQEQAEAPGSVTKQRLEEMQKMQQQQTMGNRTRSQPTSTQKASQCHLRQKHNGEPTSILTWSVLQSSP